jgi:hypothetical protein
MEVAGGSTINQMATNVAIDMATSAVIQTEADSSYSSLYACLNPCDSSSLCGRLTDNWQEFLMLSGVVFSVFMAVNAIFWGMLYYGLAYTALGVTCLYGANLVRQIPTFERMRGEVETLGRNNVELRGNVEQLQGERQRIHEEVEAFNGLNKTLGLVHDQLSGDQRDLATTIGETRTFYDTTIKELKTQKDALNTHIEKMQKLDENIPIQMKLLEETTHQVELNKKASEDLQKQIESQQQILVQVQTECARLTKINETVERSVTKLDQATATNTLSTVRLATSVYLATPTQPNQFNNGTTPSNNYQTVTTPV